MSLDKLKSELNRAKNWKLDKLTAEEKQKLLENLTDVFCKLSDSEKYQHIKEFLDLKQNLDAAFALSEKMSSSLNKAIERQIRLASNYQKKLEEALEMSLPEYLSKQKKSEKRKKTESSSRLSLEQAQEKFWVKEIDGKKLIVTEGSD